MLRGAIWLLLAFAGAVVLALVLSSNHGNVAIFWPPYRIEMSSNMAVLLTALSFFVLYVLLRLIGKTLAMPQRIRNYGKRRRLERSNRALQGAVLALFEGRYDRAERLAATAASTSREGDDGVAAASLVAARSAHRLGALTRRDDWLRQAAGDSRDNPAALMVQAEFALDDQQPARALEAVDRMTPGGAQQPIALEAALGAYQQSGRWDRVLDTVRQLSKRGRMSLGETQALRLRAYRQLLVPLEGDARAIRELWKSLRSDERKAPELAAPTVAALARASAPDDARKIALGILDSGYDEATVEAYGGIAALSPRHRLEQLERWRVRHGEKPKLLEMLGRICASEKLWGKAEAYLMGSLAAGDTVSARVALAQLYESIDRPKDAALQFQAAARLALGERPPLPGPASTPGSLGTSGPTGIPGGAVRTPPASSMIPDGDVGTIPVVQRPDRQELHDRLTPKELGVAASPGASVPGGPTTGTVPPKAIASGTSNPGAITSGTSNSGAGNSGAGSSSASTTSGAITAAGGAPGASSTSTRPGSSPSSSAVDGAAAAPAGYPAAGAGGVSAPGASTGSNAAPAVDLKAGAGDEFGLVRRKE